MLFYSSTNGLLNGKSNKINDHYIAASKFLRQPISNLSTIRGLHAALLDAYSGSATYI